MKFEQVCQNLNAYFSEKAIGRTLLPLSVPLMLGCAVLRLVSYFISIGSFASALVFLVFFAALLLVLSTCNFRMTAIGLGVYAAYYVCAVLRSLIVSHTLAWGSLLYLAAYGYLAYAAYRKSVSLN